MSIKVTLTANELFRFAMYHIYHARTGIFSLIAGAVAVILAVTRWGSSSTFEGHSLPVHFFLPYMGAA